MESPSGDRLALLYRLSQTFNSSLDLDEVLNRVMDEVIAATRAERGFLMLREADGRLSFRVARGMDQTTIEAPQFQISRSLAERVAQEGQPMLTSDAQRDARFSMRQSIISMGLRSILCVPLTIRERITGIIYVDNRHQAGIFVRADLDLLVAIASSAAMAIENARLYQVAVEKGRLEREFQMARDLQASLLPHEMPQLPGWEVLARWLPAREVAGDFYDFIPAEGGQLGWLIADVSDKGMPAALFMALSRSIVRASLTSAPSPAEGIARANRLICADAADGMFVTLFYAQLDPVLGRFTYVNAGHDPPILCRPKGSSENSSGVPEMIELKRTGILLGVDENALYEERTLALEPGNFILCYTDGVTDALDAREQEFGVERLQRVIIDHGHSSAAEIVAALAQSLVDFTPRACAPFDDMTILAIRRL